LTVTLTSPVSDVYTRGIVSVQVDVAGGTPDTVELLKDSDVLATLAPPYQYSWDTTGTPEGRYALTARAKKGGQAFSSAGRMVVVDRTSPRIVSRSPAPGSDNVSVHDPIIVEFSEPILPSSVTSSSVSLASLVEATVVPSDATLSADGTHLTVIPRTAGKPANFALSLTGDLTDLAGNALTPERFGWTVPVWLRLGGPTFSLPGHIRDMALDSYGDPVVAVWSLPGVIQISHWTGTGWEPVGAPLSSSSAVGSAFIELVVDRSGAPIVAFTTEDRFFVVLGVWRWNGSAWQSVGSPFAYQKPIVGPSGTLDYSLAVDGAGQPVLAIERNGVIDVQRWTGTTWQPVGSSPSVDAFGVAVKTDANGEPTIAYFESPDGVVYDLEVQQWDGATWHALTALNSVSGQSVDGFSLSLERGTGKPVAAILESDGTEENLYVAHWAVGIHRLVWQPIGSAINVAPPQSVDLAVVRVDENDNPMVALRESDGTRETVYVQRWNGANWEPLGALNPTGHDSGWPSLEVDASGRAVVAFEEADDQGIDTFVFRLNR
jgi:hypothetical protein